MLSLRVEAWSPSCWEVGVFREVIDDVRVDNLLSLDEELMDDTYCDDVDNTVVVFDTIVEESVVTVLDVDVAVEDMDKKVDVECWGTDDGNNEDDVRWDALSDNVDIVL